MTVQESRTRMRESTAHTSVRSRVITVIRRFVARIGRRQILHCLTRRLLVGCSQAEEEDFEEAIAAYERYQQDPTSARPYSKIRAELVAEGVIDR